MSSQRVKLKDQILDGIARSVKEVQAYSFSSDGEVVKVNNEARPLQRLVEHLDHAFLHGLKHITPGYWVFVRRFTHKLVISDILALDRLATDLGRSRAWLYQSLNEGALESYFRCFQDSQEILKKFYIEHALMRDSERLTLLMTLISGLDFVTFDLELNVAYFDLVSHIPRSASDIRDLDDTVSIHSNLSLESATSSMVNDLDGHASVVDDLDAPSSVVTDLDALVDGESRLSVEGSPRDVLQAGLNLDESIVKGSSDEKAADESQNTEASPREIGKGKGEEDSDCLDKPTENSSPPLKTEDPSDVTRPLTLDLEAQSNKNGSTELKHVTRNYSTPDFDINMEKVAEQDQSLEVIRIPKKSKKKKKKRKSKDAKSVLQLQDPRMGRRRDRSSSPSTVSVTSSCIEEELEDKVDGSLGVEGGEGSISSATNQSEWSAVEEDVDCGKVVLASSLPECENMTYDTYSGTAVDDLKKDKERAPREGFGVREEIGTKGGMENVLIECSEIMSEILDCVCKDANEQYFKETFTQDSAKRTHGVIPLAEDSATLRLPSFADPKMHDSFNSSVDGLEHSMIYWQADITDNSFDAELASSTPVKSRCRISIQHDQDDAFEDDVFVQDSAIRDSAIDNSATQDSAIQDSSNDTQENLKDLVREHHKAELQEREMLEKSHFKGGKGKSPHRTLSGTLEYEHTVSVELTTQKTDHAAALSVDVNADGLLTPDSGINECSIQSITSVGNTASSLDSLSSGISSNPDSSNITVASSSCTSSAAVANSDCDATEAANAAQEQESCYISSSMSIVQVGEEDDDGFVLVDVVDDPTNKCSDPAGKCNDIEGKCDDPESKFNELGDECNDLGERSQGDGKDASMDPLCVVDVNANPGGGPVPKLSKETYDFECHEDGEKITSHEAEMKVDNNLKLYLMLEIFKIEDEKYHKLIRLSTGHMEGNLLPAFVLLTDLAIYILRRGERNGRFSTESRTLYQDLDYVLIGLNYQSVQLVCKNRRKQFWLTTGSQSLTRFFLHSLREVMVVNKHNESLCVLTDATAQAIGLKKYVSGEEKVEMSEVKVHLYTLVHWEDLLDSSTAADLQLYLPATKRKGMLHYKTKESFFVGSYWKPAFFKLKQNVLKRYTKKDAEEPDLIIDLGSHKFGGCRRVHYTDRRFSFELVFTDGSQSLQLSCENELQLSHWLQSICEVASHQHSMSQVKGPQPNPCQPSCSVITSRSVLLCLEDYQTHFFRTLARTDLCSISHVERSQSKLSYLVMNFKNSECDNPWLLYFNCCKELDKFIFNLSEAYRDRSKKDLKIRNISDEKLAKRCSDCHELILSAWQRSDSLGRGRVRGDSW